MGKPTGEHILALDMPWPYLYAIRCAGRGTIRGRGYTISWDIPWHAMLWATLRHEIPHGVSRGQWYI